MGYAMGKGIKGAYDFVKDRFLVVMVTVEDLMKPRMMQVKHQLLHKKRLTEITLEVVVMIAVAEEAIVNQK